MADMPTLRDVFHARSRIAPMIRETPVAASPSLAGRCGPRSVHLKLECLQETGAFKVRGAANKILGLDDGQKRRGVITFSTGNHGRAVAHVAARSGIQAVVCLSEHVAPYRAEMIRELGAELSVHGRSQDEAEANYRTLQQSRGLVPVVPFDDPMIIAGQGTLALEILARLPETDVLLVPLSGGGLLAGVAMAAKTISPGVRVVGLSIERSPAMLESLKAGSPTAVEEKDSIADSLLGGIGAANRYTLPMVERFVDEHVRVSEEEIKDGMFHVFQHHRLVVEGAAAVGVAALLHGKCAAAGRRVVALLTGSTVDSGPYLEILRSRMAAA